MKSILKVWSKYNTNVRQVGDKFAGTASIYL